MEPQHILSPWILPDSFPTHPEHFLWTRETGCIADQFNQSTLIITEELSCFSGMMQYRKLLGYFLRHQTSHKSFHFAFTSALEMYEVYTFLRNAQHARLKQLGSGGIMDVFYNIITHDYWVEIKSGSTNLSWKRNRGPEGFFFSFHYLLLSVRSVDFIVAVILNASLSPVRCTRSTFLEGSWRVWLMVRCVLTHMWP